MIEAAAAAAEATGRHARTNDDIDMKSIIELGVGLALFEGVVEAKQKVHDAPAHARSNVSCLGERVCGLRDEKQHEQTFSIIALSPQLQLATSTCSEPHSPSCLWGA